MTARTTVFALPPQIRQRYDAMLFTYSTLLFRDNSRHLLSVYDYINNKLIKRVESQPKRKELCSDLKKEFEQLYARILQKEEDLKEKTDHHTQRPFYRFKDADRKSEEIFRRLRYKR